MGTSFNTFMISLQSGIPTLLIGEPGTGKTAQIEAAHRTLKRFIEVLPVSTMDPTDVGMPWPVGNKDKDKELIRIPPDWARHMATNSGTLFLDEFSTAPPSVQAALLRVVRNKKVHSLALHEDTWMAAATNPVECSVGGYEFDPPTANRWVHLNYSPDPVEYCTGLLGGFPDPVFPILPDNWKTEIPAQRALVSGYLRARPEEMQSMPKEASKAAGAWPSQRTWENLAIVRAAAMSVGASDEITIPLASGCVGEGAGSSFCNYADNLDLPNPEDLLADPDSFMLPERGDQQYAVFSSVVAATLRYLTEERWDAAWVIIGRGAQQGAPDVAAVCVMALADARTPDRSIPSDILQKFVELFEQAGFFS